MLIHGLFLFFLHPPLKQWAIKGVQGINDLQIIEKIKLIIFGTCINLLNILNVSILVMVENFQPLHPHNFNNKNVYF
jgi:hypothetical protein